MDSNILTREFRQLFAKHCGHLSAEDALDKLAEIGVLNESKMIGSVIRTKVSEACANGMTKHEAIQLVSSELPVSYELVRSSTYSTSEVDLSPTITSLLEMQPLKCAITVYDRGYAHFSSAVAKLLGLNDQSRTYYIGVDMGVKTLSICPDGDGRPDPSISVEYSPSSGVWMASFRELMIGHRLDYREDVCKFILSPPSGDKFPFELLRCSRS